MRFQEQIIAGKIHAKTPLFAKRLAFAQAAIDAMLEVAPKSYVSLSFGKQSTCVAHMVWLKAPETPMHFLASEETWDLYDYKAVIRDFCGRFPIRLTIHQTRRISGSSSWKESRDAGDRDLQDMCPREEWDGWFWGLAKEESPARKKTLLASYRQDTPHAGIFRYSDGKYRCCPLMHWTTVDIAAYVATRSLPLLNIYKRFGLEQRTTARITKKMLRNQGMSIARMTNSGGFRRLVNKFPEINIQ